MICINVISLTYFHYMVLSNIYMSFKDRSFRNSRLIKDIDFETRSDRPLKYIYKGGECRIVCKRLFATD